MWRGIETIVQGKDPREVWLYTQRICGVCTTVHAIASVRTVEQALKTEIPLNAQYIRNLMCAAHAIQDHLVHFYQTALIAQNSSSWPMNSAQVFSDAQQRLKTFAGTGQMGIFINGYWGHPAMRLSPEMNLLATAHYLQALEIQRKGNMIVSILGGKTPHIQNLAVGGVANAINTDSPSTLTMERLYYVKTLINELGSFVNNVYFKDVCAIAAAYPKWTAIGACVKNYPSVPDFPIDGKAIACAHPGGYLPDGDLSRFQPVRSLQDEYFSKGVQVKVKPAWYEGDATRHPWEGETKPHYTDFQDDGKYSWAKAPTFYGKPAQVGPSANVLCMYAAGHEPTKKYADLALATVGSLAGQKMPVSALHSIIGRHAARAVRAAVMYETLQSQWQLLMDNIGSGNTLTFNRPEFPKGEVKGVGYHEAPRGVLSHWVVIEDEMVKNYQAVVPSTWNSGPRNGQNLPGPYEASLVGTPVADPEKPLEVLRTVHSFDPCLACAVHLADKDKGDRQGKDFLMPATTFLPCSIRRNF